MNRSLALAFGLAVATLAAGCGNEEPPKAPPKEKPAPVAPKPPPEIDAAMKQKMDADMTASRAHVEEGRAARTKGDELAKAGDTTGAKIAYDKALSLMNQSYSQMGHWCETTDKDIVLSAEQRAYYTAPLAAERLGWLSEIAQLGRLVSGH